MCVWREQCSLKEFGRLCFCRIFLDSFLGNGGSAAFFFAWVAVFLAVGGSFFAGWAREDARGALISRYDEQVYVWSGDIADAYARKWRAMGETADGLPALTIQRTVSAAATTHAGLALQTDTDLATGGDLPGDTGSDFARYDQGAVLTTTIPNFHSSSMLTERGAATFSVTRGGAAYSVTAAPRDCKTVIEKSRLQNGDPQQEYTVATWRYLTAVELYEPVASADSSDFSGFADVTEPERVQNSRAVAEKPSCRFTYTEWRSDATRYVNEWDLIGWFSPDVCEDVHDGDDPYEFYTPGNVDLTFTIRSERDPHVFAGNITECTWNFGRPAEDYRRDSTLLFIFAGVSLALVFPCLLFGRAPNESRLGRQLIYMTTGDDKPNENFCDE